jgi:hypothetical protein
VEKDIERRLEAVIERRRNELSTSVGTRDEADHARILTACHVLAARRMNSLSSGRKDRACSLLAKAPAA